ncbi:hypothetical protein AEAC466_20155 [Asticcacaulis sp. AC466]|uniref:sel1 repeat family protein n=1 Tax=Asticcacaulis sp. AC466 TaxID=1282362 RepID=UPI0003C3B3B2|nr:sel1 repeat family protein [Asticcacaulis sp. AC466]ESQ81879.1 hypothetical protein AEAC466_20155 [Asticcacaulis sp. AC466]
MKTLLITAAIAALSVQTAHAETAQYNWAVRVIDFSAVSPFCIFFGFDTSTDRVESGLKKAMQDAVNASSWPNTTNLQLQNNLTDALSRMQSTSGQLKVGGKSADSLRSLEAVMTATYPTCAAYANDIYFKPYIQNGPFQLSGRPATALDFVKFKAENGSAKFMVILSGLYGEGAIGGKPDRQNAFVWMRKAGLAGDADAAGVTAGDYAVGNGTQKDLVQAEQWHRMAIAMGGGDPAALAQLEKTMTPAQIAEGKAAAHKWLAENEYE